ncbi:hypothetical protein TVAG_051850 [Trichomonas vaginalis G3]|uniref:Uncharacterized protein n=1 Tax=Trichomonas vaginalis (strain ATCC PRA-98 / G3) TaxID=412133 RepID=A2FIJ2_TRIV3|nr:serine-type peptidase protein [Trichomonas vaginalis G3]EAX95273.1 hypothetical protein TVAG_051850 [Trichomonas vaginalis G3]KAI5504614.1 serine-type peptidase protein [Trichomonas vaginalis G3]|eukprot:XP_001308203.1 hypothetical protein [Trichomonas vaginalis G3]
MDQTTFNQYAYIDKSYIKNGTYNSIILTLIDSEVLTPKEPFPQLAIEIANQSNSLLLALEIRYFDNSVIGNDTAGSTLCDLTIEQIHADIAQFIFAFEGNFNFLKSRILLVGADFAASILSWFRYKYPQYSIGIWGSYAQTDIIFQNTFIDQNIKARLTAISEHCYDIFHEMFNTIHIFVNTSQITKLNQLLQLFDFGHGTKGEDALYMWNYFFTMIDYFPGEKGKDNLERVCERIKDYAIEDFDKTVAEFARIYKETAEKANVRISHLNPFNLLNNSISSSMRNDRLKYYLKCSQLGNFHVSNGFISPMISTDYYWITCFSLFGINSFRSIHAARKKYRNPYPGTVSVFTSNKYNIHHNLMPSDNINNNVQVIELPGIGRFFDTDEDSPKDYKEERENMKITLTKWLTNDCATNCDQGTCILEKCRCNNLYEGEYCQTNSYDQNVVRNISMYTTLAITFVLIFLCSLGWYILLKVPISTYLTTGNYT